MLDPGKARKRRALALALGCVALTACGGVALTACGGSAAPKVPVATRVCRADLDAVRHLLGVASLQIASTDPANIECRLTGGGARLDVVAQASPRAWTQFDTDVVHVAQSSGPGSQSPGLPRDLSGLGYNAAWIASKKQLVATNGTQSTGGSFVTIVVSRSAASRAARGPSDLTLARAVATATLALAPRGPSPGPPPS